MGYRENFKDFLDDLSKGTSYLGGGSCCSLASCIGISLLQMALRVSSKAEDLIDELEEIKKELFVYVDLDGETFFQLLREKDKEKKASLLDKVQEISFNLGKKSYEVFNRVKDEESSIKNKIKSDFYLGVRFLEIALYGSISNLKANQLIFKIDNSKMIDTLFSYLEEIKKWLKF